MNNLKTITPGSTIERRVLYNVEKVNKKSIVVSDVSGNSHRVSEKEFHNYNAIVTNGTGTKRANGRMPNWANTEAKKDFVCQSRHADNSATESDWKAYQEFKKTFK